MQTNKSNNTPVSDETIQALIARLDKTTAVIDSKAAEEHKNQFHSQSLVYAAFLTDYQEDRIVKDAVSKELLGLVGEFCDLIESLNT